MRKLSGYITYSKTGMVLLGVTAKVCANMVINNLT